MRPRVRVCLCVPSHCAQVSEAVYNEGGGGEQLSGGGEQLSAPSSGAAERAIVGELCEGERKAAACVRVIKESGYMIHVEQECRYTLSRSIFAPLIFLPTSI